MIATFRRKRRGELRREGGILAPPRPVSSLVPVISAHTARRKSIAACVAVALAIAPLAGVPGSVSSALAQSLPDLGDVSQTNFSPVQERKLGETIIRQLRANGAYINDPEVNDYLNELGHRLVAASKDVKQDFEFFGVPDPQVNAFALPGGFIGVHTGLILLTQSESELGERARARNHARDAAPHGAGAECAEGLDADVARRPGARDPRRTRQRCVERRGRIGRDCRDAGD